MQEGKGWMVALFRHNWSPPIALVVAVTLSMCSRERPADTGNTGEGAGYQLELTEVWSQQLPDSFAFAGVTGPLNHLVLWSLTQHFLLLRDSLGHLQRLHVPMSSPPLSVGIGDAPEETRLIFLNKMDAIDLRLPADTLGRYRLEVMPQNAGFVGGEWYMQVSESVGVHRVIKLKDGRPRKISLQRQEGPVDMGVATISDVSGEALLTGRYFPFQNYLLDHTGSVRLQFTPVSSGTFKSLNDSIARRFVSLPTLPLDTGYLQTIADLRSLTRYLVTYDGHGAVIRVAEIQAPMGFIRTYPNERIALAFRQVVHPELAAYRWRWVPESITRESRGLP